MVGGARGVSTGGLSGVGGTVSYQTGGKKCRGDHGGDGAWRTLALAAGRAAWAAWPPGEACRERSLTGGICSRKDTRKAPQEPTGSPSGPPLNHRWATGRRAGLVGAASEPGGGTLPGGGREPWMLPSWPPAAPLTRASTTAHPVHATRYFAVRWAGAGSWGLGWRVVTFFAFSPGWLVAARPCFSASRGCGRLRCVALVSCWVGGDGCCVSCRVCCCAVVLWCRVVCCVLSRLFFPSLRGR